MMIFSYFLVCMHIIHHLFLLIRDIFLRLYLHLFCFFVWIMTLRCRHAIKKHSSLYDRDKLQKNPHIHYTNSALTSDEQQFEPWTPVDSHGNQQNFSNPQSTNQTSIGEDRLSQAAKASNTSYFTRHYGWDEIEQNEDETKRFRQLFSIWDSERIAILKLQHDLDRNIFERKAPNDLLSRRSLSSIFEVLLIISNAWVKVLD